MYKAARHVIEATTWWLSLLEQPDGLPGKTQWWREEYGTKLALDILRRQPEFEVSPSVMTRRMGDSHLQEAERVLERLEADGCIARRSFNLANMCPSLRSFGYGGHASITENHAPRIAYLWRSRMAPRPSSEPSPHPRCPWCRQDLEAFRFCSVECASAHRDHYAKPWWGR